MYFWWERVSVESPRGAIVLVFRWLGLESQEEPLLTRLGRSFLCSPHWGETPVLRICGELWGAQPCPASWSQQGASWWQQAWEISGGLSITAWGSEVGETPSPSLQHFRLWVYGYILEFTYYFLWGDFCWSLKPENYCIQMIFYVIIILFLILK